TRRLARARLRPGCWAGWPRRRARLRPRLWLRLSLLRRLLRLRRSLLLRLRLWRLPLCVSDRDDALGMAAPADPDLLLTFQDRASRPRTAKVRGIFGPRPLIGTGPRRNAGCPGFPRRARI